MSDDIPADDTDLPADVEPPSRDVMLSLLDDGIQEAHRKATSGRVYNPESERVRQGWIRVLAYAAGQYRQLKKDKDLDELDERLTRIEEARKP